MNVYYTPIFLEHKTGRHPERPERLSVCVSALEGAAGAVRFVMPRAARRKDIERIHSPRHVDYLEKLSKAGGGMPDPDTVMSGRSFEAALLAAGAAVEAALDAATGRDGNPLALVRPPGHHARPAKAMGFCLLNNVAIAAARLLEEGIERLAILDFDVHHGNGTQEAFYDDGRVMFVSFHRSPFYPGTGSRGETGAGEGEGLMLNVPLPHNTSASRYLVLWREALRGKVAPFAPEVLLVSAGFDNYRSDPVGGLNFEQADFRAVGESIRSTADGACGGRVASILEGGYDLGALPGSLLAYLAGLGAVDGAEGG